MGAKKVITPIGPGGIGLGPESPNAIRASTPSEKLWDYSEPLRKILGLVVGETPEEQLQTAISPSPLISMYKNVAARKAATEAFRRTAKSLEHPAYQLATEDFVEKYPRIAAHINLKSFAQEPESALPAVVKEARDRGAQASYMTWKQGKLEKPISVYLQDRRHTDYNLLKSMVGQENAEDYQLSDAINAIYHEGSHVAAGLGTKDYDKVARLLNALLTYETTPTEALANKGGINAVRRIMGPHSLFEDNVLMGGRQIGRGTFLSNAKYAVETLMQSPPSQYTPDQQALIIGLHHLLRQKGIM